MGDKRTVKIFVASAGELPDERDIFYKMISQLNKAHKHLFLEVIEWETEMVKGSYFDHENIQAAINPKLIESDFAVFLFYTRIGKYTREEYELARKEKKQTFVCFKKGFSPDDEQIDGYRELLQFKKSMGDIILKQQYADMDEFEKILYPNLNLYMVETYPVLDIEKVKEENVKLSASVTSLLQVLTEKDKRIKELEEGDDDGSELAQLIGERDALQQELLKNKEIQKQQAQDKEALEQQLGLQKEHDVLKAKALEEVEKGNYDEAEYYLKESAKESIEETAATFYELGKIKKLQLKYKEAFEYYELAARINDENSLYLNDAGEMADIMGYYDTAINFYEKTIYIDKKNNGEEHPDTAVAYNNFGSAYDGKGEYDKAIDYYEKALTIDRKNYGDDHSRIATRYNNLGLAYYGKGEYDKAVDYYEEALKIGRRYYGEEHPDISTRYNNLGLAYNSKGKYNEAIEYYEKALIIDRRYYGEEHPGIAIRYNNLGLAYDGKGEFDKAIEYYEKALTIGKKYYGEDHPTIAIRYDNLGSVYNSKGEYDKAVGYHEKALTIGKKYHGEEHPDIAICYNNLGLAYYSKGEYATAIDLIDRALILLHKFLPANHPHISIFQENLKLAKNALNKK